MSEPAATGVVISAETSGLACTLTHGPSGTVVETVPPKDNGGTGAAFSPTDLVATGLAACALTTMALAAKAQHIGWGNAKATVEKRMTPSPRRIGELVVKIWMPEEFPESQAARFEEIARLCPVARSLNPDIKIPMEFIYP